jgi:hypothetical protein
MLEQSHTSAKSPSKPPPSRPKKPGSTQSPKPMPARKPLPPPAPTLPSSTPASPNSIPPLNLTASPTPLRTMTPPFKPLPATTQAISPPTAGIRRLVRRRRTMGSRLCRGRVMRWIYLIHLRPLRARQWTGCWKRRKRAGLMRRLLLRLALGRMVRSETKRARIGT